MGISITPSKMHVQLKNITSQAPIFLSELLNTVFSAEKGKAQRERASGVGLVSAQATQGEGFGGAVLLTKKSTHGVGHAQTKRHKKASTQY